ncbi:hypothetical protein ED867_20525, partial [Acinetobacter baumannii]
LKDVFGLRDVSDDEIMDKVTEDAIKLNEVEDLEHWINCCRLSKLPLPNMEHGLDLADGTYADQYIGKWALSMK